MKEGVKRRGAGFMAARARRPHGGGAMCFLPPKQPLTPSTVNTQENQTPKDLKNVSRTYSTQQDGAGSCRKPKQDAAL